MGQPKQEKYDRNRKRHVVHRAHVGMDFCSKPSRNGSMPHREVVGGEVVRMSFADTLDEQYEAIASVLRVVCVVHIAAP
jgi:hypothetical protein